MRKYIIVLGLLLVFAGIVSASTYDQPVSFTRDEVVKDESESWEISSYFQKGENISVLFKWNVDFEELYEGDLPVNVTMTTPGSTIETKFQVLCKMVDPRYVEIPPGRPPEYPIYVYKINLLHLDSNTLAVTNPPRQIGGIAQQNTSYTARIIVDEGAWWVGIPPRPPLNLRLLKRIATTEYPFTVLGPVGASTTILGAVFSVLGIRKTKPKAKIRKSRR